MMRSSTNSLSRRTQRKNETRRRRKLWNCRAKRDSRECDSSHALFWYLDTSHPLSIHPFFSEQYTRGEKTLKSRDGRLSERMCQTHTGVNSECPDVKNSRDYRLINSNWALRRSWRTFRVQNEHPTLVDSSAERRLSIGNKRAYFPHISLAKRRVMEGLKCLHDFLFIISLSLRDRL